MNNRKNNILNFTKLIIICLIICFAFSINPSNSYANNNANANKETKYEKELKKENAEKAEREAKKTAERAADNEENCIIPNYINEYTSSCYSCYVVKILVETFMEAAVSFYKLTKEAATIILTVGSIIWITFYALRAVSSWVSVEPANLFSELLMFLFKVLTAYVFINAGVGTLVSYSLDPIISAGADYGIGVLEGKSHLPTLTEEEQLLIKEQEKTMKYEGPDIVGAKAINKIFEINIMLDKKVSTNLIVGNVLMCHAQYGGSWVNTDIKGYKIRIPNIWLLICGFAIWFVGFMLTLSISYYLLDVSFKIALAVILIPIGIALYVFELTKDRLSKCISIIIKSGAILAFLSITTSYMFVLIDAAFGDEGVARIYDEVREGKTKWISERFDITGSYLLLLLFSYFYSIKLVGATISEYVEQMFKDGVLGSSSPLHNRAKQGTEMVDKFARAQAGNLIKAGRSGARALTDSLREEGGSNIIGNTMKLAGKIAKTPGNVVKNLGKGVYKAGENLSELGGVGRLVGKGFKVAGKTAINTGELASKAGKGLESMGKDVNELHRKGKAAVSNVANSVKEDIKDIGYTAQDKLKSVQHGAGNIYYKAKNATLDKLDPITSKINEKLQPVIAPVSGAIKAVGNTVGEVRSELRAVGNDIRAVAATVNSGLNVAKDYVVDKKQKYYNRPKNAITETYREVKKGINDGLVNAASVVVHRPLSSAGNALSEATHEYALNPIKKGANTVGRTIKKGAMVVGGTINENIIAPTVERVIDPTIRGVINKNNQLDKLIDISEEKLRETKVVKGVTNIVDKAQKFGKDFNDTINNSFVIEKTENNNTISDYLDHRDKMRTERAAKRAEKDAIRQAEREASKKRK